MLNGEAVTTLCHIPPKKQPKCCDDLFLAAWELKWEGSSIHLITLSLKFIPSPEFGDKLSGVRIDHNTGIFPHPRTDTPIATRSKEGILLTRQDAYEYDILSESLDDYVGSEGITAVSCITIQSNTFNIIEAIDVPYCYSTMCDFGNILAFSEEQSREKFCDVTLTSTYTATLPQPMEDTMACPMCVKFFAHKAILAVRSPVFAKMFMHNMQESVANAVNLPDIEPDVLKELLIYIYTTESPNLKEHATSLLYQAEKYQLGHLKALCERRLSYDLHVDNVAKVLLLADACSAEQLKRNALLYISEHGDKVTRTEEWKDIKKNPNLMGSLLDVIFEPGVKSKRQRLV